MKLTLELPKFLRKSSSVFQYFSNLDTVVFQGAYQGKVMVFSTLEQSQKGKLFMMSIIRREEMELWQSFRGLIEDIFSSLESKLVGIFRFELISLAMSEDLQKFQWKEFSCGMSDLAKEIPVGGSRFVQYCSLLGVLTKLAYEEEGRIQFDPHVQIIDREPQELDVVLEKLIAFDRNEAAFSGKRRFVFYDLSRRSLYNPNHLDQSRRLQNLNKKLDAFETSSFNEIVIVDGNGRHTLFVKSQMELELF